MRDPNHIAYKKGDRLFKKGLFLDAAASFETALYEWPEDWQAMWALGNCYSELKKPRKAEKQFANAIQFATAEDLPGLYFNLGNALFDQGLYAQAIEKYHLVPPGHHLAVRVKNNISLAKSRLVGA